MKVHPKSQKLMTIIIPKELYVCKRLMWLNEAPAIWQRYVDGLFQVMDGVKVFTDDIRITGSNKILHFTALEEFFRKRREHGLRLNLNKTSDASPVGIACVLSHIYPDGSERPIAFASRTLSGSEQKYSQIEKEVISIVWAVKSFIYT
ncbi:retrovirus-related Pol polyprotein from transposon 17.6 [Trichonephila clavipes]|uniref:Retrovirus-related Pol polyprotein from transposon 17.6 n=1 Tax=Trichonephila clavipes TaxID=2585209 RepID=A0A8X6RME9_TRICX|nr:retrovirus-related Pol polyprotein from transposon 17.6 [Trichonephila clavipes]